MTTDRFKDGVQWWMDTTKPMSMALCPNPPQWHIDACNLVRLVPQRPWVGLTDEEVAQAMYRADAIVTGPMQFKFAKELEAKLKEKNA